MERIHAFPDCLVVHVLGKLTFLLEGPRELIELMTEGTCFDDNTLSDGYKTLPTQPGVYACTVEYWFQQGWYDGDEAPGESDWEFRLAGVRRILLKDVCQEGASRDA